MDAQVIVKGTVQGLRTGQYEGKAYAVAQLQTREGQALRMIEINLPDDLDPAALGAYSVGKMIEMPVRVSASKDGKRVFFRATGANAETAAKPDPNAAKAARG